jgi:hypothetical protein
MKYKLDSSFHLSRASSEQAQHRSSQNRQVPPNLASSILTRLKLLEGFVNHLLSTIRQKDPLTEVPKAKCWRLEDNDHGMINLNSWNPRQANQEVYRVVALLVTENPKILNPIHPEWAVLGEELWTSQIKSVQLPSKEMIDIQDFSHILLVVNCEVKIRTSKKKHRFKESRNTVLVPADFKVRDLVNAFKGSRQMTELGDISDPFNITVLNPTKSQTVADFGWKHGTELRLELS